MVCSSTDLDKLDNEKKNLIQSDISALHHFYSKHLEFPDHESLFALFAQVRTQHLTTLHLAFPCQSPLRSVHTLWRWMNRNRTMASTWGQGSWTLFCIALLGDLEQMAGGPLCAGPRWWVEHRKFALPLLLATEGVYENRGVASAPGLWHTGSSSERKDHLKFLY